MPKHIVVVGSLNLDMVATVPRIPLLGETLSGTTFRQFLGGKGANQACAAALLGGSVQMIGRHGNDGFEAGVFAMLREKRVGVDAVKQADAPSGVALILVTEQGYNSIVVIPGANAHLCAADVHEQRGLIAAAGIVLCQLETPLDSLAATLEVAAANAVPVMLDPAPAQHLPAEILRTVTWLTPNETEAAILTHRDPAEAADMQAVAEQLLAMGPENVLLKLGERGAYVATRGGMRRHIPAPRVNTVDSTAAGDALNGAFAVALIEGAGTVEAARFAVSAASLSVTRPGAIASLPTRAELEAFLQREESQQRDRAIPLEAH